MNLHERIELADRLFKEAFSKPREPRSPEYQKGVHDGLRQRVGVIEHVSLPDEYLIGTAAADAWFYGLEEGHARWREYVEKSSCEKNI